MCRNRLPVSERTRNQIILVKNQICCFSDTNNASEYPFFGPPYDFHRGLPTLQIIGIGPFFFQPRHIVCALWVKNVAEARRAAERVELERGKNMLTFTTVFFLPEQPEEREI